MKTRWFFGFFLVSGFCSLVYEVVWLRLAMAAFGVTTPMISIVLSVFMMGLALGSWGAGLLTRRLPQDGARAALRLYAICELAIAISGVVVPYELTWGRGVLERFGSGIAWGSSAHYLASGAWVALALLPFCAAMGATFPLAMAALRHAGPEGGRRSFSYLYLANVIGATAGTLVSALFLIEMFGFRGTLLLTACLNAVLAVSAFLLSGRATAGPVKSKAKDGKGAKVGKSAELPSPPASDAASSPGGGLVPWLLFATGLLSMAMEVVWVRQFTPFYGTVVYTFATILAIYLGTTFLGSIAYRRWTASAAGDASRGSGAGLWLLAGLGALLPLLFADPRALRVASIPVALGRVILGIGPFCFVVGFLTPMLVDRWSSGDPRRAGRLYAINMIGCLVGPLAASFVLLPALGEHGTLTVLSLPLFTAALLLVALGRPAPPWRVTLVRGAAVAAAALALVVLTRDFETIYAKKKVLRDYTATVIAEGEGMQRQILVNGYGMTVLTPVTKMMAHLPLAFRADPPKKVLVICFGMGTTFRSSLSWGVPTTVVELVPSVPSLFGYFHDDADRVRALPGAQIVIDDGRRYLERSRERFDVITVDPPPPVEAAGSSLLYSREFLEVAKSRLAPDGILQNWFPGGEQLVLVSIARALKETFPYVRVFNSHQGWGVHFLASQQPIPPTTAAELARRVPAAAAADMVEWEPGSTPEAHFEAILAREIGVDVLVNTMPDAPAMTDDRPLNEYFLIRRMRAKPPALPVGGAGS